MNRYKFSEAEHVHSLGGKPLIGTTTCLSIVSKELTWWSSGMCAGEMGWLNSKKHDQNERLIKAGAKLTDIKLMNVGEYLNLLDTAYKAHNVKKEARAQEGTDLHSLAEEWIGQKMQGIGPLFVHERLKPFVAWCEANVKQFLFSEIHCYSERLWVGGKTDFGYEDLEGNYVLADIKSRDKDYFTDHLQCGLYDIQLSENGGFDKDGFQIFDFSRVFKPGENIFQKHAIFTLGNSFIEPVFSKSVEANRKGGEHALELYKIRQQFEGK